MMYRVEYHRCGVLRGVFRVPAESKVLVGDYVHGKPYGPNPDAIADYLPYHVRSAFWRGANGWYVESPLRHWRFDLYRKSDNAPLGTVFAFIDGESVAA